MSSNELSRTKLYPCFVSDSFCQLPDAVAAMIIHPVKYIGYRSGSSAKNSGTNELLKGSLGTTLWEGKYIDLIQNCRKSNPPVM